MTTRLTKTKVAVDIQKVCVRMRLHTNEAVELPRETRAEICNEVATVIARAFGPGPAFPVEFDLTFTGTTEQQAREVLN